MQKHQILCVDDEQHILDLLRFNLEASGYEVVTASTGSDALTKAPSAALILLDLMLPDMSGFDILESLRRNPSTADTPVIVLTARETENDTVVSFEKGADDYIKKPFSIRELTARVKAVLRRTTDHSESGMIQVGPLTIDSDNYEIFCNGKKLSFTLKEYELLKLLAECPGKVLTRDFLLDRIWGYEFYGETRTVDVHIRHIRMKLAEDASMIETVRGIGYKLANPAS